MSAVAADRLSDDLNAAAASRPCALTWPVATQFTTRNSQLRQRGFTLVELLIVISLISILAAMAVVQYRNSIQSGKEAVLKSNLFRMRDAIDQYYADKG